MQQKQDRELQKIKKQGNYIRQFVLGGTLSIKLNDIIGIH
jgi:hypothetical protein